MTLIVTEATFHASVTDQKAEVTAEVLVQKSEFSERQTWLQRTCVAPSPSRGV